MLYVFNERAYNTMKNSRNRVLVEGSQVDLDREKKLIKNIVYLVSDTLFMKRIFKTNIYKISKSRKNMGYKYEIAGHTREVESIDNVFFPENIALYEDLNACASFGELLYRKGRYGDATEVLLAAKDMEIKIKHSILGASLILMGNIMYGMVANH